MDIARLSIDRPMNTWLLMLLCLLGGIWALMTLGRLEDPAFTIKQAIVVTAYPGATALEVEEEVTELMESAIQQLPQLRRIQSRSLPGLSEITVEIKDTYNSRDMPQIWDELRRKVSDAQGQLPPGAANSRVVDDFGDVFGIFYAVTAEGFSDHEIRELARFLRRELLTVPGVAKVSTAGEPEESIYIEVSHEKLTRLGLPVEQVLNTLQTENSVEDAGELRIGDQRVRLVTRPGLDSLGSLEALRVGRPGTTEQLSLIDIARIERKTTERPEQLIRFNGTPAFTLAVAGVADTNIVKVGQAVDAHLASLQAMIPLGVELHPIYEQHRVVDEAINSFMLNLAMSVAIVIGVLCLFMGWRVGVVVGLTLLLTVLGTTFFMRVLHIEMERISLGALIIAMGMLVDNAIVVAEGMLINMQKRMDSRQAASDAVQRTQLPLLGATVIGIMAFAGIGLSPDATGEFMFSLFAVIGISLLLSWVLAVTVTPLLGHYLFRVKTGQQQEDLYAGAVYGHYRKVLRQALAARKTTLTLLVVLTLGSYAGFGWVKQAFFPDSNTPLFYVNYELPLGTDIRATARDLAQMEAYVLQQPEVVSVASFIGQGASRFMLTYEPRQPDSSYGQLIVRVADRDRIDALAQRLRNELGEQFPDARIYTERLVFGPGGGARIQARFSGPDMQVLRELGEQARNLMEQQSSLTDIRHDWREKQLTLSPVFNEERARYAGISRHDLAETLKFSTEGVKAGTYREGVERLPIIARPPDQERLDASRLQDRLIWSSVERAYVPLTQVVERFELVPEEAVIHRRDRVRTLTVLAEPAAGYTADQAFRLLRQQVEALPLPEGYRLEWGGEYENSRDAQASLAAQLPLSFIVMLVVSVLLFGRVRQPLVIWLVVPMSAVGVVAGLLLSGLPFGFTALLGFLSLSGMLMKNAIVLVEEMDLRIAEGGRMLDQVIEASVSRLRPVFLAAGTTILGMLPLLSDALFASMAITIMGGLAFATLLTLIAVPVLYMALLPGENNNQN
ncbi:efflux RND transporter permease subunit [Marinospirillum alkaliphilum]|uniref:Multidrug efflux pump subunit AcrB n=1 Tax=Marinospirillum alkaliphilum DSM 21637 TaxID=1122209 RepID=A0A1K1YX23_9GAMM|nr:efflux RND transporter permease subunit [Marinospirillum alkaliphilum]SFX65829.1 Multidrug efflux pump subunit AcrB [Marinospirillum alkaliphilum DSM 21637]